jgi:methyl-accepting chemotaxis protein
MKKKLITILVLVGIIPIILVSGVFYKVLQDNLMENSNTAGLSQIQRTQSNINEFVEKYLNALRSMADNPALKNRDLQAAKPLLVAGVKIFPDMSMVMDDLNGNQIVRGDDAQFGTVGTRDYYKLAVKGEEAISEPLVSSTNGKTGINFAVPIKDNNGQIVGVLQSLVVLDKISEFVKKESTDSTDVFITDKKGMIIAQPKGNLTDEEKNAAKLPFVKKALSGETGSTEYINAEGQKMLVYYTADKLTGWAVYTETPYDIVMSKVHEIRIIFIIMVIVTILLVSLIGYVIAGQISKPIICLRDQATLVASGKLQLGKLSINRKDEIGELSNSFNNMTEQLANLVKQVQDKSQQVATASGALKMTSEQSATASNQVADSINKIAAGSQDQLKDVQDASTVVESMAATLEQITATANEVAISADAAFTITQSGQNDIESAVVQISNVSKTATEVGHTIAALEKSSEQVSVIVNVITEIAGQTNLLALNAAIEAARAGENGKGFAVVADEVRKLAEQSRQAAQDITGLISNNTVNISKAVQAMEEGTKDVQQGIDNVNHVGEDFKNIYSAISTLSGQVREISTAIENIAEGSQRIVKAISGIGNVSKNEAAEVETVSAATEEQLASIEDIASSSQELSDLAENLRQTVNKFQI